MTSFEQCSAEVLRRYARATGGLCMEIAGGVAADCGAGSPLSVVKGMEGGVGAAELRRVVDFYAERRLAAIVEIAPWVEEESAEALAELGFEKIAMEDLMAREAGDGGEDVPECADVEEWARMLSLAFFGEVTEEWMAIGRMVFSVGGGVNVGVWRDGLLAAGANITLLDGVALFAGDATLERYRGRGLQQLLIRGRMRRAWEGGCGWFHCEVVPGSGSQRNYERCGFTRAYSRFHYRKTFSGE